MDRVCLNRVPAECSIGATVNQNSLLSAASVKHLVILFVFMIISFACSMTL